MKTSTTSKWAIAALLVASLASCDKDDPAEPTPDPIETESLTINQLKALSTAASVTISKENTLYKVKGVVISDNSTSGKNIDTKTAVLAQEDNSAGIIVNFAAAHSFAAGTEVEIGVSNQKLEQVDGEIVLNAIPLDSAKTTATGKIIAATETTIANIITNKASLNGTLVKVAATELTSTDGKYNGTLTVKDASGELTSVVLSTADFSGDDYPPSVSAFTGIVRISGDATRIDLRTADDVVVGDITKILTEDFDNLTGRNSSTLYIGDGVFSTAFGAWTGTGAIYKGYGGTYSDAGFTTDGKYYPYIFAPTQEGVLNGYMDGAHITTNFTNLQDVKTVTITFAGSNASQINFDAIFGAGSGGTANLYTFVEGTDYIRIGIIAGFGDGNTPISTSFGAFAFNLLKYSEKYDKIGQWYTLTYTVPTKAELLAAGVNETMTDLWLANPNFDIINYSSSRTGVVAGAEDWAAPILISKIEFGF